MRDGTFTGLVVAVAAVIVVCAVIAGGSRWQDGWHHGYLDGYRQGTIDALTGKAQYELRTNDDGEQVWGHVKEQDDE